jgi:hypothetical protein
MHALMTGMSTMGFVVAALFFLRFWHRTSDPLFLAFAAAFVLLALNQALLSLSVVSGEDQSLLYLLRVAAFALLIGAIVAKNIGKKSSG